MDQTLRFISLQDAAVRHALLGSVLLGIACGLLGSFLVVRKLALIGDTLSHAVLPGVALGFLWNMTKDPTAIFIGATAAGLLGTMMVGWITSTTRLKEDAALGLVLATFFAVGICITTMIQRLPTGNKSGIDKYLFGQAAAMSYADVVWLGSVTALVVVLIVALYHGLLVGSFDASFAHASGVPARLLHHVLMLLLSFAVVTSLQAVGVVLVSAMLITPAATAYLLTDRMHRMLVYAALIGAASAAFGAGVSFLGARLPTGPFMVLAAAFFFLLAFFFAPRRGLVVRAWRRYSRSRKIEREDTLKAIYRLIEDGGFDHEAGILLSDLARNRGSSAASARRDVDNLVRNGFATEGVDDGRLYLTPHGYLQACLMVRNHRLWELYLTNAAQYTADHVHEDAEKIEHILGEDIVNLLEKRLQYPHFDPHGKPIPSLRDMPGVARDRRSSPSGIAPKGDK